MEENMKWFAVSLTAIRGGGIVVKRCNGKTYPGSLRINDLIRACPRKRSSGYVMLQLQRNGSFAPIFAKKIEASRFLDATVWSGISAEEVEEEVLKILLENYRRDEGWTNHRVVAREIDKGEMDAIAGTLLKPILDKYKKL